MAVAPQRVSGLFYLRRIPPSLFLGPDFPERARREGINDLLRNTPLFKVRAKLVCRLLGSLHKQDMRDRMGEDFHTRSIGDCPEVIRIRSLLTAKENVPHQISYLSRVGHPVSLEFRAEPPYYAIVKQQLLNGF